MTTGPITPLTPLQPASPGRPLADLRGPAAVSVFFAGLVTLIQLAEVVLALVMTGNAPGMGLPTSLVGLFTAFDLLGVLMLLALVGGYVGTCLWMYRAHERAESLAAGPRARRRGWAWAGWLVPVVCLWFPFQVVRDASLDPVRSGSRPAVRGWWWASLLAFALSERIAAGVYASPSPATAIEWLAPTEAVSAAFACAAFVLWTRVVRTTTRDHEAAAARWGGVRAA